MFEESLHGQFKTIVVDIPWPNKKAIPTDKNWPCNKKTEYKTMTLAECMSVPFELLAHPDGAHVWFWTKVRLVPEAITMFKTRSIGFSFILVWRKLVGHLGKTDGPKPFDMPKYDYEPCLYGRIGKPGKFLSTKNFKLILDGQRREHSRKPEEFYNLVDRVCPGPKIDVFARQNRPDWTVWGDETSKF